jgi:hypothetical protein
MSAPTPKETRPQLFARQLAAIAAAKLAMHVAVNATTSFGFQRDEFLYFAMGQHLRLWRMDFPPGIAMAANAVRWLLGDSMTAIRMVPAIAGTLTLVVAVMIARELGGGRFAQGFTALAFLVSPLFLRTASLFQPVVLDQLAWTVALYALVRLGQASQPRWWLLLGAALGAGLLMKFSALIFGFAVFLAIVVTPHRAALRTRWPWLAAALAFAIGSPSIVGQVALHYPVVGQMAELRAGQLGHVTYASFFLGQLEWGLSTLVAIAGAWALVASPRFRAQRLAGWACVLVELTLMVAHGKSYYAGPVMPTLIAAGAVMMQQAKVRWGVVLLSVLSGAIIFPIALPVLSPQGTAAYIARLHLDFTRRNNQGRLEVLPQDFADMMGWEQQAAEMARAYAALTDAQRREVVIGASNYGRAGALDYYGPRHGLPRAISTAGSYWFFGPGALPGNVALIIENEDVHLRQIWDDVHVVGHVHSVWSVTEESDANIYLCQKPRHTLQELWPTMR